MAVLALVVVACSGSAASGSPGPSNVPSNAPSSATQRLARRRRRRDRARDRRHGHPARLEEGGGFVAPCVPGDPGADLHALRRRDDRVPEPDEGRSAAGRRQSYRFNPFRTARLSEDQIQATLERAIGEGGLGAARPKYENNMVADASTTIFTVNAGGLKKTVSVYALGMDDPTSADVLARAAFAEARRPRSATSTTAGRSRASSSCPTGYRGILLDGGPGAAERPKAWPWPELKPSDFVGSGRPEQLPAAGPRPDRRRGRGARGRPGGGRAAGRDAHRPGTASSTPSRCGPLLPGETYLTLSRPAQPASA